jgi:hypothetical protein
LSYDCVDQIQRSWIYQKRALCIDLADRDGLGVNLGRTNNALTFLIHTKDFSPLDERLRESLRHGLPAEAKVCDTSDQCSLKGASAEIADFAELFDTAKRIIESVFQSSDPQVLGN